MEEVLLHPVYFGPVSQYIAIVNSQKVIFENEDNYQKQTYRNRMYIYDSNGKLPLTIPIRHLSSFGEKQKNPKDHQKYKEVKIENDFEWQKQHWRALKASYQTSPFFEFYEDDIFPLYHKKFDFLIDFNYACLKTIIEWLQMTFQYEKTQEYALKPKNLTDLRHLVNAKPQIVFKNTRYAQVFESKYGFIPDLSILDLIFHMGPNSIDYLEAEKL